MQYMCLDLNAIDLKAVRMFKCNKILVKKLPMYRVKKSETIKNPWLLNLRKHR